MPIIFPPRVCHFIERPVCSSRWGKIFLIIKQLFMFPTKTYLIFFGQQFCYYLLRRHFLHELHLQVSLLWTESSLDPLLANHNQGIFSVPFPRHWKTYYVPPLPSRQKVFTIPILLHIFSNNTYTDFRTANKHYSSDLTEPKCQKNKQQLVVWQKLAKINIWSWALKTIFYYTKFCLTR